MQKEKTTSRCCMCWLPFAVKKRTTRKFRIENALGLWYDVPEKRRMHYAYRSDYF